MPAWWTNPRFLGALAVPLVLAGTWTAGAGLGSWTSPPSFFGSAVHAKPPSPFAITPLRRSNPTKIRIPAIGVNARLISVGLKDGEVELPSLDRPTIAGWYRPGPAPGEVGPAVIVGHVSSRKGPAVFYRLGELRPGATIEVQRSDGKTAVFQVDGVEKFPKKAFPAERVFGEYTGPSLRLITCGGAYVGGSVGYADNIVVFASLIKGGKKS